MYYSKHMFRPNRVEGVYQFNSHAFKKSETPPITPPLLLFPVAPPQNKAGFSGSTPLIPAHSGSPLRHARK